MFEDCEDYEGDILRHLNPYPEVQFRFLWQVCKLSPENGMKIEARARRRLQPKTVVQLLELLCRFEPMLVHVFLQGLDEDIQLDDASKVCKKYNNEEGEAFLIERMGDSERALHLLASAAHVRLRKYVLRPQRVEGDDSDFQRYLDRLLGYQLCLDTCKRNSERSLKQAPRSAAHSKAGERIRKLWSFFFKTFHDFSTLVGDQVDRRQQSLGATDAETEQLDSLERCQRVVQSYVNAIVAEMLVFLPQHVVLQQVFQHCANSPFGDVRSSLEALFSSSQHQSSLMQTVKRIMQTDIAETRRRAQRARGAGIRVSGASLRDALSRARTDDSPDQDNATSSSSLDDQEHDNVVVCMRSGECFRTPSTELAAFLHAKRNALFSAGVAAASSGSSLDIRTIKNVLVSYLPRYVVG